MLEELKSKKTMLSLIRIIFAFIMKSECSVRINISKGLNITCNSQNLIEFNSMWLPEHASD